MSRKPEPKSAFLQDRSEFLSIWAIAHEWETLNPQQTNPDSVPAALRRRIDKVVLGYLRKELGLRKADGYRVLGRHWLEELLGLDKQTERLWDCLTKGITDVELLDNVYVMRSEILHWCAKEFIEPPACWAPVRTEPVISEEENDDKDGWYEQLTERRRKIVACLELAKYLWKQDRTRSYEDVYNHPTLVQSGLRAVFSAETFKKWARPFAPEEAKRGGRRPQSDT